MQADLDQLASAVRARHPQCVPGCPADFESRLQDERHRIPPHPASLDLRRAASRVLRSLHDAHTAIVPASSTEVLPVRLVWRGDHLACVQGACSGSGVVALDGTSVTELRDRNRALSSAERTELPDARLPAALVTRESLELLGVAPRGAVALTLDDGGDLPVAFVAAPVTPSPRGPRWHTDPVAGAAVLELTVCANDDEYRAALASMFGAVAADGIDTVVVDLRNNGGGDSRVIDEFVRYLDVDRFRAFGRVDVRTGALRKTELPAVAPVDHPRIGPFAGEVVVLTSRFTFSSALAFAASLQDQGLARVVGEEPAGYASAQWDVVEVRLRHSGIRATVSTAAFWRPDVTAGPVLVPDVVVPAEQAMDAALG